MSVANHEETTLREQDILKEKDDLDNFNSNYKDYTVKINEQILGKFKSVNVETIQFRNEEGGKWNEDIVKVHYRNKEGVSEQERLQPGDSLTLVPPKMSSPKASVSHSTKGASPSVKGASPAKDLPPLDDKTIKITKYNLEAFFQYIYDSLHYHVKNNKSWFKRMRGSNNKDQEILGKITEIKNEIKNDNFDIENLKTLLSSVNDRIDELSNEKLNCKKNRIRLYTVFSTALSIYISGILPASITNSVKIVRHVLRHDGGKSKRRRIETRGKRTRRAFTKR